MGLLARMMGWLDDQPNEKTVYPRQNHQYPMGPGGVTGEPEPPTFSPWGGPPGGLPRQPLSAVMGPAGDMSGGGSQGMAGFTGGMEPQSAPGAPSLDLNAEMAAAMQRAQSQPQSDPMLDWYRSQGQQDLSGLRDQRNRYSWQAQDYSARRDRLR